MNITDGACKSSIFHVGGNGGNVKTSAKRWRLICRTAVHLLSIAMCNVLQLFDSRNLIYLGATELVKDLGV